jgi:hypothetical protein
VRHATLQVLDTAKDALSSQGQPAALVFNRFSNIDDLHDVSDREFDVDTPVKDDGDDVGAPASKKAASGAGAAHRQRAADAIAHGSSAAPSRAAAVAAAESPELLRPVDCGRLDGYIQKMKKPGMGAALRAAAVHAPAATTGAERDVPPPSRVMAVVERVQPISVGARTTVDAHMTPGGSAKVTVSRLNVDDYEDDLDDFDDDDMTSDTGDSSTDE